MESERFAGSWRIGVLKKRKADETLICTLTASNL